MKSSRTAARLITVTSGTENSVRVLVTMCDVMLSMLCKVTLVHLVKMYLSLFVSLFVVYVLVNLHTFTVWGYQTVIKHLHFTKLLFSLFSYLSCVPFSIDFKLSGWCMFILFESSRVFTFSFTIHLTYSTPWFLFLNSPPNCILNTFYNHQLLFSVLPHNHISFIWVTLHF